MQQETKDQYLSKLTTKPREMLLKYYIIQYSSQPKQKEISPHKEKLVIHSKIPSLINQPMSPKTLHEYKNN